MDITPHRNGVSERLLFADFEPVFGKPKKPQTAADLVLRYLDHLRVRVASGEYSARGLSDVERDLGRFTKFLNDKPLSECKRQDLIDWLLANPQWRSNSTKKRNLAQIAACFEWGAEEDFLPKNPYRRPKKLRLRTRRRPDAQPWQYCAFMRRGSRALRRILYFLWNTGCRPEEARELTWPMIDFHREVCVLEKHKTANTQAEDRPRMIGLEPRLIRFLRNLHRQRAPGQLHVFVNAESKPWLKNTFCQHFARCRLRLLKDPRFAGLAAITGYSMRHGYTTEAIQGGAGDKQTADQLGHVDTRMIAHYSHAAERPRYLRNVAREVRRRRRQGRRA